MPTASNALNVSSSGVVKFDGTATFSSSSLTQHAALIGGANNAITSIGPGTAGQVLLSGGAGANPGYVTPTAGTGFSVTANASTLSFGLSGGYILIQSQTFSGSSAVTFTSGVSGYTNYLLKGYNFSPSINIHIIVQLSSNGGSSYINTGYDSGSNLYFGGSYFTDASDTTGFLLGNLTSGGPNVFEVYLFDLTTGNYPTAYSHLVNFVSGTQAFYVGTGNYATATAMNAFQVVPGGGTITGTLELYGIL